MSDMFGEDFVTFRRNLIRATALVLVLCCGVAGMISVVDARQAILFLLLSTAAVTGPHFIIELLASLAERWVFATIMVGLMLLLPWLAPFIAFIGMAGLMMRLESFARHIPHIAAGCMVFACLYAPAKFGINDYILSLPLSHLIAATVFVGIVHAGFYVGLLRVLRLFLPYRADDGVVMLGAVSYIAVFIVLLLLSLFGGGDDADADADMDPDDATDAWI